MQRESPRDGHLLLCAGVFDAELQESRDDYVPDPSSILSGGGPSLAPHRMLEVFYPSSYLPFSSCHVTPMLF